MSTRKTKKQTPPLKKAKPVLIDYPLCPHCGSPVVNVKWLNYGVNNEVLVVSHDHVGCYKVIGLK